MQESTQRVANPFAMPEIQASRRLVKSPPELWAEVSDAASLARHLGEVGEITITRLEPETTVAWEGERASGTIELAPAGWGTSVTLTAELTGAAEEPPAPEPAPEPIAVAEPEPVATIEPEPEPAPEPKPAADATPARRSWLTRLFSRTPKPLTAPEPEPSAPDADRAGGMAEDDSATPLAEAPRAMTGPARQADEPEPEPEPAPDSLEATLTQALDSLGQAHHRPFSRG